MKKTSRRSFGKQLAGALVALPLASRLDETHGFDQREKTQDIEILSEHNTPPPGTFMGGSLVFEAFSDKSDWNTDGATVTGGRRTWSVKPKPYDDPHHTSPTNIFIAHVKLIDGAGEQVIALDNSKDKDRIEIIATLVKEDGKPFGDCSFIASGDHFELSLPSDKRLKKKRNDHPANSRRQRVRYMHESGLKPDRCKWLGLKVVKGAASYYDEQNLPKKLPGYDETMRLMVWWENH